MNVIYLFILFIPNNFCIFIKKSNNKKKTNVFVYYIFMYFK